MIWFEQLPKGLNLDHLLADVRYGLRGMRRSPGFNVTAVLMLGLGIGINAAVFSVFSRVLLAPLRFADPDGLYIISSHAVSLDDARRAMSGPDFKRSPRSEHGVFRVAAVIPRFSEPWTGDGPPRVVRCSAPTPQFFSVMGIKPVLGRLYTPESRYTTPAFSSPGVSGSASSTAITRHRAKHPNRGRFFHHRRCPAANLTFTLTPTFGTN